MSNHRLLHLAWNISKLQKNQKRKFPSSSRVVYMKFLFKRWVVEAFLELPSDVMRCIVIEERLMEPLREKWEDAKRQI